MITRLYRPRQARTLGREVLADQITLTHVSHTYRSRDGDATLALDDVSQVVPEGSFTSIVGPSGCGKSTLLRLVAGLAPVTSGRIDVGGELIRKPSRKTGIVFQQPVLLPWLTIAKNVQLPAELRGGWPGVEISVRAQQLLEMVGLGGLGRKYPFELSGGMQQRVAIARSLITEPSVLLMDEPFGALDAMTRERMNGELLDVWMRGYPTVLFITHDIQEAVFRSDTILIMSARPGRLVQQVRVDLPRPRAAGMLASTEFVELAGQVRGILDSAGR